MSQLLYEAIAATRAGNKKQAQLLLAQNLQQDPTDAQSWYLLGMLVDSKEKQAIYLGKALALDPAHAKAQERLGKLQTPTAVAISDDPLNFIAQAEGDSLPEWLAEDADALQLDRVGLTAVTAEATAAESSAAAISGDDALPDWLQEDVSSAWESRPETAPALDREIVEAPTAVAAKSKSSDKRPSAKGKKASKNQPRSKQQQAAQLNLVLGLLILALIVITVLLLYYTVF